MPSPSFLTWIKNRRACDCQCPHQPTLIESFDLITGELINRSPYERNISLKLIDVYDDQSVSQTIDQYVDLTPGKKIDTPVNSQSVAQSVSQSFNRSKSNLDFLKQSNHGDEENNSQSINQAITESVKDSSNHTVGCPECRSQVWHILTQCQRTNNQSAKNSPSNQSLTQALSQSDEQVLQLARSLTPPPPFSNDLVRQASYTHLAELACSQSLSHSFNSSSNQLSTLAGSQGRSLLSSHRSSNQLNGLMNRSPSFTHISSSNRLDFLEQSVCQPTLASSRNHSSSSLFSQSIGLSSSPSSTTLFGQSLSNQTLCCSHPSMTVLREIHYEHSISQSMRGGWFVDGGVVKRLVIPATVDDLYKASGKQSIKQSINQDESLNPSANQPPIAKDLWRLISEYSDPIYQSIKPHKCIRDVRLADWLDKRSIKPSKTMIDWIRSVNQSINKSLIDRSGYAIFDEDGAGWTHNNLLELADEPVDQSINQSINQFDNMFHQSNESTLMITQATVEAYNQYLRPNVLNGYSYSRPEFVYPSINGLVVRLVVDFDGDALKHIQQQEMINQALNQATKQASKPSNRFDVDMVDHTHNLSNNQSIFMSINQSNARPANQSSSQSISQSNNQSNNQSISQSNNQSNNQAMHQSEDDLSIFSHSHSSPRRSSLPPNHRQTDDQPMDVSNDVSNNQSSNQSINQSINQQIYQIPTRLLFQSTWLSGDRCYRHGVKSLASEFLGVDVPISVCPWPYVSRVEFAMVFTLDDQPPQPCLILHK